MVWRPEPPTQYGKRPPTARELAFNLPYLRAQIDVISPRVVVALGAQAFEALHGRTPTITPCCDPPATGLLPGAPPLTPPPFGPNWLKKNSTGSKTGTPPSTGSPPLPNGLAAGKSTFPITVSIGT